MQKSQAFLVLLSVSLLAEIPEAAPAFAHAVQRDPGAVQAREQAAGVLAQGRAGLDQDVVDAGWETRGQDRRGEPFLVQSGKLSADEKKIAVEALAKADDTVGRVGPKPGGNAKPRRPRSPSETTWKRTRPLSRPGCSR
mgnify:CR=1 FL=1